MNKNIFRIIFTAVLLISTSLGMYAQRVVQPRGGDRGSWRILGTTQAKFSADHDIIYVKGPFDYFRKLKFKVTDAPLKIQHMLVRYDGEGPPEEINTRFNIPKGGESRVIDLRGGKRKLKSVEFWYDTRGVLEGRADITLFGMK